MGLDTYAARSITSDDEDFGLTEGDLRAFEEADIRLCECNGGPSFRGKLYDDIILDIAGQGLRHYWLSPDQVSQIQAALEGFDLDQLSEYDNRWRSDDPMSDIRSLRQFFRICAERGLGITNSW